MCIVGQVNMYLIESVSNYIILYSKINATSQLKAIQ